MWTIVLKFIKQFWRELIIAILLGTIYFQHSSIQTYKTTIITLKEDIAVAKNQVKECRTQIDVQNESIRVAAEDSKKNVKAMDDLAKSLDTLQKDQKLVISKLRNQPAPKTCEEIQGYLKKAAEDLSKW